MILRPLTPSVAAEIAEWRNQIPETLRSPAIATEESQWEWCEKLDPNVHRYWELIVGGSLVGVGGLTYISLENRSAEISLLIDPDKRKQGFGRASVFQILKRGFQVMNLDIIYGECYECSGNVEFWKRALAMYPTKWVVLPDRKYWDGRYWDSHYFSIRRNP